MKKVIFTSLLVVAGTCVTQAQFKITPKAGVMMSKVAFSDALKGDLAEANGKSSFNTGFSAGAAFEIGLGDMFSVQPEILFTQKGLNLNGTANEDGEEFKYEFKQRINHVEVPLLFKASFGEEDALRFSVYLGPYISYALGGTTSSKFSAGSFNITESGKVKFGKEPENYNGDDTYYDKDEYNRLDYGVYAGAGASYPLGPGALSLEARYGYGLANFAKDASGQASKADLKSQYRAVGVFLGYSIPLGN